MAVFSLSYSFPFFVLPPSSLRLFPCSLSPVSLLLQFLVFTPSSLPLFSCSHSFLSYPSVKKFTCLSIFCNLFFYILLIIICVCFYLISVASSYYVFTWFKSSSIASSLYLSLCPFVCPHLSLPFCALDFLTFLGFLALSVYPYISPYINSSAIAYVRQTMSASTFVCVCVCVCHVMSRQSGP